MAHKVLDVGNCGVDHSAIRSFLSTHFGCDVIQAHGPDDTLAALKCGEYDLVLVNRKLDRDYTDGIEVIRQVKADADIADVPVMLVTNYPEHQEAAMAVGAIRGFGKLEFDKPETLDKLKAVLT
jgi:CheY-like chemotaxis protein